MYMLDLYIFYIILSSSGLTIIAVLMQHGSTHHISYSQTNLAHQLCSCCTNLFAPYAFLSISVFVYNNQDNLFVFSKDNMTVIFSMVAWGFSFFLSDVREYGFGFDCGMAILNNEEVYPKCKDQMKSINSKVVKQLLDLQNIISQIPNQNSQLHYGNSFSFVKDSKGLAESMKE